MRLSYFLILCILAIVYNNVTYSACLRQQATKKEYSIYRRKPCIWKICSHPLKSNNKKEQPETDSFSLFLKSLYSNNRVFQMLIFHQSLKKTYTFKKISAQKNLNIRLLINYLYCCLYIYLLALINELQNLTFTFDHFVAL